MAALVAYDLLILRRGAGTAFSRRRDMLLLALALPVGTLLAWNAAGGLAEKASELPLAVKVMLVGLIGFAIAHASTARLVHLREHSMVARQALHGGTAAFHAAFWNALPLIAALTVFPNSQDPAPEVGALLASYAAGAAAAPGWRSLWRQLRRRAERRKSRAARVVVPDLQLGTRRQRLVRLLIARSGLRKVPIGANLALFAGCGAMLGLLLPWRASHPPAFAMPFAALATALLIGRAMRQHPPLLRYLVFLGIMPTGPALVPLFPLTALVAGFVAATAGLGAIPLARLLGGAAACLIILACIALLRGYHHASKSRQAAEFVLQIDFAIIAAAALIAPPFAPAFLLARLWTLRRSAVALRYSLQ
jgi:hypothetical protein